MPVSTAEEMRDAVRRETDRSTIVIMAAAVADYRPANPSKQKIKKQGTATLIIECERTTDILREIARRRGKTMVVGFAAETDSVIANGARKLEEKKLDLIVVNDVSRSDAGFDVNTNAVTLIDTLGSEEVPLGGKDEIADRILDRVVMLRSRRRNESRPARRGWRKPVVS